MKLVILILGGLWLALLLVALVGAFLLGATQPRRRRNGLCAVPGCGRAAGHWKAD